MTRTRTTASKTPAAAFLNLKVPTAVKTAMARRAKKDGTTFNAIGTAALEKYLGTASRTREDQ
jgi:hypothetical protein